MSFCRSHDQLYVLGEIGAIVHPAQVSKPSRKIDLGGIGVWDEVAVELKPVVWAAPSIQLSYVALPEPPSVLAVHAKVGAAVPTQAVAVGETSAGAVGALASI